MRHLSSFALLVIVCVFSGCSAKQETISSTVSSTADKQTGSIASETSSIATTTSDIVLPLDKLFPPPYFPEKDEQLLGIPLSLFSKEWSAACIYSERTMNSDQISFIDTLPKMQDPGKWGLSFDGDYDGDGFVETVNYGAYQDKSGTVGNFLLVTRKKENEHVIVLLRVFPETGGRFVCFYLRDNDHSLLFGSGLISGEVNWELSWTEDGPTVTNLALED